MSNRFDAFFIAVIVILTLILIQSAGGAYYQELKRYRSADTPGTETHVPTVPRLITIGMTR